MKLYKLTDQNDLTYNGTQWGAGITHSGTGKGILCGPGWIHVYKNPILAVMLNPIHTHFKNPHIWLASGEVVLDDHGLKFGVRTLTTLKRFPVPIVTIDQRATFGILCALRVYHESRFVTWANDWLSGQDRTYDSAWVVHLATKTAKISVKNATTAANHAVNATMTTDYYNVVNAAAFAAAHAATVKRINLVTLVNEAMRNAI